VRAQGLSLPEAAVARSYALAWQLTRRHPENFLVVSVLVPRSLRPSLAAVYAYCRGVDDLGDEYPGDRKAALRQWREELLATFRGNPPPYGVWPALADTVRRHGLPLELFLDLVRANEMDQERHTYETYQDLQAYCRYSANPVGRMVLGVFGVLDEERARLSDATCTALQLTNHWQDVAQDYRRGRLYLPLEDLRRFGLTPQDLFADRYPERVRELFALEVERARALFRQGQALEAMVPGRLGAQLALYRLGGEAVLDAIQRQGYAPHLRRPALTPADKARLFWRAVGLSLAARPGEGGANQRKEGLA
jgi:squalene synthase HpnC